MVQETKMTLMLAQAASAVGGLLSVLNAGWTQIGPDPSPFAIAGIIELPWTAAGVPQTVRIELLDDQGKPVMLEGPEGDSQPVLYAEQFDVAPQPGIKRGTPLARPIAVNFGPLPLTPGCRYEWRAEVNGETKEDWRLGFSTRPPAQFMAA